MAEIAVQPIVLQDMVIIIPGTLDEQDDFAAAVSSATITPSGSLVTWKGLKPDSVHSFPVSPTFALDLEYAQDWSATDSLSRTLWDRQGEVIEDCILEPQSGVGTRWTFDLIVATGAIGGAVDAVATSTVSLGISGKPVPTAIV